MPRDQANLSIPYDLDERVKDFIENGGWGYKSKNEVARQAIREFLQRHEDRARREGDVGEGES